MCASDQPLLGFKVYLLISVAAMIPDDGIVVEEIMTDADIAMYQAKAQSQPAMVFCRASPVK